MRRLTFALLMIMSMCVEAFPQRISDRILLSTGEYVTTDHAFLEGENFELTADKPVKWKFYVRKEIYIHMHYQKEEYVLVKESQTEHESFSILLREIEDFDWDGAIRFESDIDDSTYFKGLVSIYDERGNIRDDLYLKLNLLPSIPKITSVRLDYTYNWEYGDFDEGLFEVGVTSDRAESFDLLAHSWSQQYEFPTHGGIFQYAAWYVDAVDNGQSPTYLKNEYAQWGEYHKIGARNKYGYVWCPDTLNTLDYVTDPVVLADIEKNRPVTHLHLPIQTSDIKIYMSGNNLRIDLIDDKTNPVVSIYNLTGNKLIEENDTEIDLSSLAKGYYIVRCVSDDNSIVTSKIYKP